ncbi:MAG: hypothetical protein RMJ56_00105 [Gemmataceae bacterium]|nr:hypothetical protein [Gemmata sp.]MDW8195983.1 hypothetical protein [Gemmataceae bacterium]
MAKAKVSEEKLSQKKMVQAALETKGWDAKNAELQEYIREQFDTELAPNVISNYKSIIKRESGKPTVSKRGRKGTPQFSDLEIVCGLVNRLGVEKVRQLVDMAGVFS